jgi:hypothetical protein
MGITPDEGIIGRGIGVDRDREHVWAPIEDALGTVAVVHVDVEDGDALMPLP